MSTPAPFHPDDRPGNEVAQTKPFTSFVQEQRNGSLHVELSEALAEVTKSVQDTGKDASLTMKITVKAGPKGSDTIMVSDQIAKKLPAPERDVSIFFADDRGNLSRQNPRQPMLPLRRVDDDAQQAPRAAPAQDDTTPPRSY